MQCHRSAVEDRSKCQFYLKIVQTVQSLRNVNFILCHLQQLISIIVRNNIFPFIFLGIFKIEIIK